MTGQAAAAQKSWGLGIFLGLVLVGLLLPLRGRAVDSPPDRGLDPNPTSQPDPGSLPAAQTLLRFFLPVVSGNRVHGSGVGVPIWSHPDRPAPHEVVLFRHIFALRRNLQDATLQVFADTRYEVWVDGVWIGRGPARFSTRTHEYDSYGLGALESGDHLVAVLVQWAPNNRRSESTTPHLIAQIEGTSSGRKLVVAGTGPLWKSFNPEAWAGEAAPVHSWGLIGPTELLDFRRLPANWMGRDFNDSHWAAPAEKDLSRVDYHPLLVPRLAGLEYEGLDPSSFEVLEAGDLDPSSISFRPRSLPMLGLFPVTMDVLDAGRLSPGRRIGELQPDRPQQEVLFSSSERATRTIEVLCRDGLPEASEILVDGNPVSWRGPSTDRPDVCSGELSLSRGEHRLSFLDVPAGGLTFALTDQGLSFDAFPFGQGLHAGRRLLLSEPVSDPAAVEVSRSRDGLLNLRIENFPAYVVVDLGRTIHGRLSAAVNGPPGAIVDVGWDERLYHDSLRPLPYPGSLHPQWNQVDSWVLDGTKRQLGSIDARAGRYLLIAAWGEGPVQIGNLQVYEERLPLTQVGEFSSTDPLLNAAWKIGAETLYPNMADAYADPWRERGQWWGDAYVADHANRVVFGDAALLRRGVHLMAEAITDGRPNALAPNGSGLHMLDYGMLWVQSLMDYVERTGDLTLLEQVYPRVVQFLEYLSTFESPATGLLDIPEGHWTETTYIDTIGQASRYGQSTAVNALYFGTLIDASRLAELAGDPGEAARLMDKSASIQNAVNEYLFRPRLHRYISSIRGSTTLAPTAHAQAWALAYGLVPPGEVEQVAGALLDLIAMQPLAPDVEIYGTFWVLEALGRAGQVQAGIDLIKVYYGHLFDSGATTTWEIYNADQYFTQALSHAWGSSPTWFLTAYLLGARQTGPASWEVQPAFAVMDQAFGRLPLPQGPLEVSWEAGEPGVLSVSIVSPPGASGNVVLPQIPGATVTVDGANWPVDPVNSKEIQFSGDLIYVAVSEGMHEITSSIRAEE